MGEPTHGAPKAHMSIAHANNTVVEDIMKSSIHMGATGTCTAVLHVLGLGMHHNRPVDSLQTLDTGTWGSADADQRY